MNSDDEGNTCAYARNTIVFSWTVHFLPTSISPVSDINYCNMEDCNRLAFIVKIYDVYNSFL